MGNLNFIWAEDLNGWIGKANTIPWHIPADMRFFRQQTLNHPIIMGNRTFASLGNKPLPKRQNIVVTSQQLVSNDIIVKHSLEELKDYLQSNPADYYVIGGATIYRQLLPLATRLYRTVVNLNIAGDTKMPTINYDRWHLVNQHDYKEAGRLVCRFEEWHLNKEKN